MGRVVASSSRPRFAAFLGICAAFALSGCIGNSVFDDLNNAQPVGSPFSEALFKNYSFLARSFGTQSAPSGQAFDSEGAVSLTGADNTISGVADGYAQKALLVAKGDEDVQRAITYFTNQSGAGRMDYAGRVAANEPIGSGVTEAACKVIVKQRLCGSGMKWKEPGAAAVLSLRCLSHTPERWSQFWAKVDRWGFPVAA